MLDWMLPLHGERAIEVPSKTSVMPLLLPGQRDMMVSSGHLVGLLED